MYTDSPFHLAVRKGDSRLELEPTGASLLGNASSSPPGSCLAWQGPSWQARCQGALGGRGREWRGAGSSLLGPRPWELGQWRASLLGSSSPLALDPPPPPVLLSIPQRGILETPPPPHPGQREDVQKGSSIGKARNTHGEKEQLADPESLLRGLWAL